MADQKRQEVTRYSVDVEMMVGRLQMPVLLAARMFEVGIDGCRIRFAAAVDFEVRSTVELLLKTGSSTVHSLGSVERVDETGLQLDISFTELGERGKLDIQALLDRLEPIPGKQAPVARPKAEMTKREPVERPVEPMRLRKHDRHPYQTPVWIGGAGSLMQFRGITEDLSKGGCLIHFDAPTELSVGMEVEVWLRAESGMFRVTGSVRRRTEDQCGIGAEFDRSNTRSGREVDRLIASCMRSQVESGRLRTPPQAADRVSVQSAG
jgi:hypothetical protein